jgi:hypothetical protein
MPRPNPLLTEILEALHPEKPQKVEVNFRGVAWVFQTTYSNKLEDWATRKVSPSASTAIAFSSSRRVPEMAASTVTINGKDLRTIFADELQQSLGRTISQIKERPDLQEDEKSETIEDLVQQTSLDLLCRWMDDIFTGDMVSELYRLYQEKVKTPAEKKAADFFGSSGGTPPTPTTPPTT